MDFGLNVGGRNCDRAVEGSTAVEEGDQLRTLLRRDAREIEPQIDRVEKGEVLANGIRAVHLSRDRDAGGPQGNPAVFRQDLEELDPAGGDTREVEPRRRDGFARPAGLHRPIRLELVVAPTAKHAPERLT